MRKLVVAIASFAVLAGSVPSSAAPCRDAKGRFAKCPTAMAKPAAHCRNAKGKFAKCGLPGSHPA